MATYYVAKNGNDGFPGTSAQPRLTISAGCLLLVSGDTLIVRDGVYVERVNNVIPSNCTVMSENLRGATIRPNNFTGLGTIMLDNRTGITIDGFRLDGSNLIPSGQDRALCLFYPRSSPFCTIQNCELFNLFYHGTPWDSFGIVTGGGTPKATHHLTVRNCWFHDIHTACMPSCDGNSSGYPIYQVTADCLIEDCLFEDYGSFSVHGYNVNSDWSPTYTDNMIIRRCRFYRGGWCILLGSGGSNLQFYNNIIADTLVHAIELNFHNAPINPSPRNNNRIYNNTFARNGGPGVRVNGGTNYLIQNNLFYQTAAPVITSGTGAQVNNFIDTLHGNPQFIDAANNDFRLQSGSPAVGFGSSATINLTTDYANVIRPNPPSAGAFELSDTPPPVPNSIRCWYTFEEGVGSLLNDQSGEGNNATLLSNTTTLPSWVSGRLGNYALSIGTAQDYAQSLLDVALGSITIAFTLKAGSSISGDYGVPLTFTFSSGVTNELSFHYDNPSSTFQQSFVIGRNGSYTACKLVTPLLVSTYYRFVLTYDGSTMRAYLNGALETTVGSVLPPVGTVTGLYITSPVYTNPMQFTIDELRVEDTVWTLAEIQSDFIRTFNAPLRGPMHPIIRPMLVR